MVYYEERLKGRRATHYGLGHGLSMVATSWVFPVVLAKGFYFSMEFRVVFGLERLCLDYFAVLHRLRRAD